MLHSRIAEMQGRYHCSRRHPSMRIASLRLHWSCPSRDAAKRGDPGRRKNDLWGYVQEDSAAEAFLLAVSGDNGKWSGHERFFISAPDIAHDEDTIVLKREVLGGCTH